MKFYYPKDKNGNRIGFKTPESQVYDTNGRSLTDKLTELNSNISGLTNHPNVKANASTYGHVKLSDTYNSSVSGGNAAGGLGASQNALYNAYNVLNNNMRSTNLQRTAGIELKTSGDDSPEYALITNKYISRNDISANNLRWFSSEVGSQNIKFPLELNLSTDKGYVFGKEIATVDTTISNAKRANILNCFGIEHWDSNENINGGFGMFYYEGQDESEYNIPNPYCMVLVCKQSTARGVAIAIRWNTSSDVSHPMWINTLWDNWKGWVLVIN